jgi:hypothetical protein
VPLVCAALLLLHDAAAAQEATQTQYRVLATNKTSTMQKELSDAGAHGFELVGMTVAHTAVGGEEVVAILRRER